MAELFHCGSDFHQGERMLPKDKFYSNRKRKSGVQAICKDCERAYARARRNSYPELGGELFRYANRAWRVSNVD